MNLCGRKACSSVSTDGLGDLAVEQVAALDIDHVLVDSACSPCSSFSGASRTAGRPGASIVPMSQPLPLTQSTSMVWPVMSGMPVFTEVLPPPCSTSFGSPPRSRVV